MSINNIDLDELCLLAIDAALAAGEIIDSYSQYEVDVEYKAVDSSAASQVVTKVDRQAQAAIIKILQPSCNKYNLALLAEESADDGLRQQKTAFWCIDPMDGTLAFINKTAGYSVSIALVAQNGKPLIGVVYDPLELNLYQAIDGQGAYKNKQVIRVPALSLQQPLILQTDPSFVEHPWLEQARDGLNEIAQRLGLNGANIQFKDGAVMNACNILQQANSCYFKFPRKENSGGSIWDYAATACVFNEVNAIATDISGFPLELNRAGTTYMNHRGFLYCGQQQLADEIIQLYRTLQFGHDA